MVGIFCWYLFSQSYTRRFEEFAAQYTVLDLLCKVYEKTGGKSLGKRHADRPHALCKELGVNPPSWLIKQQDPKIRTWGSSLSRLRNSLVHEGMFGDQPATIGLPTSDELTASALLPELNRSLILAILKLKSYELSDPPWREPLWGEYASLD